MKIKIIIISLAIIIVGGLGVYYLVPYKVTRDKVRVKFRYMGYACGDCEAQYNILEISDKRYRYLKGVDVYIDFKAYKLEYVETQTAPYATTCYYYFTGYIKYNRLLKQYLMQPETGYYKYKTRFKD